jgi:integrase family protein with SAM-like domain
VLDLPDGERTWTVLGADHCVVGPAEEFLEYLRVQRSSPNTVKSYARALALRWQHLDQPEDHGPPAQDLVVLGIGPSVVGAENNA